MRPIILVIDDEPDLLHVVRTALTHSMPTYEVLTATSLDDGETLLDQLRSSGRRVALIMADHILGGGTGLQLIERARSDYPNIPAVLFTGQASATVEERACELGAHVLWKPLRLSKLIGAVEDLVSA